MTDSTDSSLILYQFAFSHFNEKVRWALDFKGLLAERQSLLPGLHQRTVRRWTPDVSTTPMLRDGEHAISGSAAIVEHLESRTPVPELFPSAADATAETRRWIEWLDAEVGPAVRLALFHEAFEDPRFTGRMFTTGLPGLKSVVYRLMFPGLVPMLRDRMNIDDDSARLARKTIREALARVDEESRETGYLVGDRFTAADLTAAALFMPCFFPPNIPFELPSVASPRFDAWVARWRDEPGAEYVQRIWADHR